jgi:signal recognition particle receptor subunit beta
MVKLVSSRRKMNDNSMYQTKIKRKDIHIYIFINKNDISREKINTTYLSLLLRR